MDLHTLSSQAPTIKRDLVELKHDIIKEMAMVQTKILTEVMMGLMTIDDYWTAPLELITIGQHLLS